MLAFSRKRLALLLVVLMVLPSVSQIRSSQAEGATELLVNGKFDYGIEGWGPYQIGSGGDYDADHGYLDMWVPELSPVSGTKEHGIGFRQAVDRGDLTFDLTYRLSILLKVSHRQSSPSSLMPTLVRSKIELYTVTSDGRSVKFILIYHFLWEASELREKEAYTAHLLRTAGTYAWKSFVMDVKKDFESQFGPSSNYNLERIEVSLELAQISVPFSTPHALWDDISLVCGVAAEKREEGTTTSTQTLESTTTETTSAEGNTTSIVPTPSFPPGAVFWIGALVVVVAISTAAIVYLALGRRRMYPLRPLAVHSFAQRPTTTWEALIPAEAFVMTRPPAVGIQKIQALMRLDDKVHAYISDRGGEISWSQASRDLRISIGELKASVERLKKAGRIE